MAGNGDWQLYGALDFGSWQARNLLLALATMRPPEVEVVLAHPLADLGARAVAALSSAASFSSPSQPPSSAAPAPRPRGQGGGYLGQEAGTYQGDDLPGQCFFCGGAGHDVRDCPRKSPAAPASSTSSSSSSSSASAPRALPFCGMCGARKDATPFCPGDGAKAHLSLRRCA